LLVHYDAGRRVLLFQNGGFCDVTPRGQLAGRGSGHQEYIALLTSASSACKSPNLKERMIKHVGMVPTKQQKNPVNLDFYQQKKFSYLVLILVHSCDAFLLMDPPDLHRRGYTLLRIDLGGHSQCTLQRTNNIPQGRASTSTT